MGVFAICSKKDIKDDLYLGTFYLQHRGQEYCGLSTTDGKTITLHTHKGLIREGFRDGLDALEGTMGIGHISVKDRQPIKIHSKLGEFTICYSGNIINAQQIIKNLEAKGHMFASLEDVEVVANLIATEDDFVSGIEKMAKTIKGSYALAILTKDAIYVARDKYGYKPMVIAAKDGTVAVSSESCSFTNLKLLLIRDVKPGEILSIRNGKFKTEKIIPSSFHQFCTFEWVYTAEISSIIEGLPVASARKNLGASLARRFPVKADVVAGVPNSGIGHALGYSLESGIPYDHVFVRYGYASRSYTKATQVERDREAKIKLLTVNANVKGKRIVLCDDSIVRGTQMKNDLVVKLREAGAREIHVRIACPPLKAPCMYGKSTRTKKELAAYHKSVEEVRKYIHVDSLGYNTIEDMEDALRIPRKNLCLSCWTDIYKV